MNNNDFTKRGLENIEIMEETGFLKQMGYSKGNGWRVMATILGFLFVGSIFFIGYTIYDGKIQLNANPNILCEGSEISCPEQSCNCGNITCQPANVNITFSPNILI